ncbi:hypothetical protein HK099_007144 [Clydaea vesicula]|uniref:Uncharacterized protein n=1 Tax=Clydaea vesicula TaxID=447962 RepID=A0AAD5XXZ5_9FUNG|nr:hypothetical protein HK099_007144 [Clydaea vesicula]
MTVYHRLYREELPQFEKDLQEYNNKKGIVPAVRKRNFATLKSAETSLVHSENDEKDNEEEEIEQVGLNEVAENVKDIDEEGGESGSDVSDSADDGEMDEIDEEGGEMDDNDVQAKKIGSFETTVVKNESEEGEKATMENNTKINLERKKMEVNSENKETDGKIKSSIKGTPFKDVIQSPKLDGILSPSKKKIKYED